MMTSGGRLMCALGAVAALVCGAQESTLPFREVAYHEGFEEDVPNIAVWASNGEEEISSQGATGEKAFEGKRSWKLDATLTSGHYHYWGAPLEAVCAGELTLSARVFLDPASSPGVSVGFGCNMAYPPTKHTGCGPFERITRAHAGEWRLAKADLVDRGEAGRDSVLRRHTVNVTGDHAGAVMDRWGLFVYGRPGDRVVVYLDDIRLEGRTPEKDAYVRSLQASFDEAKQAFRQRVQAWQGRFDAAVRDVEALQPPPALADHATKLRDKLGEARKTLEAFAGQTYAHPREVDNLLRDLAALEQAPKALAALGEQLKDGAPCAVFGIENPIVNTRLSPETPPLAGRFDGPVRLSACAGEVESVSVGVYAVAEARNITVVPTALRSGDGHVIPADALDVRVVKWWFQGKGWGIGYSPEKQLKPELLLKDADLVRVNRETKENYLRSTRQDGTHQYRLCSGEDSDGLADVRPVDAQSLQPITIPAGTVQEFWVNLTVPTDLLPGTYRGKLGVQGEGDDLAAMPVELTVHPFELAPSRLIYSIYYRAKLSPDGKPTIGSEYKSDQQYRAEIRNMKQHGVLYPTNYQGWGDDATRIRRILDIRRDVELPAGPFFNLGRTTGNTMDPDKLAALKADVGRWIGLCRDYDYTNVYFYGMDEAKGDRLKSQRVTWEAVQEAGGKTFVACYKKTFEAMGARLNCAVLARAPDPEEAAKWHSVGSLAFCYAYPQVGVEAPETYRRNFGLVLWKAGFDGAMDYAYQHGFGHVWNDFDSTRYRDHNFTYPTVDGVVDTIQWEGFREAVDDVRYATTLENAIRNAADPLKPVAEQARTWLNELDPAAADLEETRRQMAEWIVRLMPQ